jgi:hypothetical protein
MLPGCKRMWENKPSHSQMKFPLLELKSWWILEYLESNFKNRKLMDWRVSYTIRKILEFRCPKWGRMTHLDISNTSYDQKKGQESNWQFDSRPLKVRNWSNFFMCRRRATYYWKALDEGWFRPHRNRKSAREVMGPQSHENPKCGNSGTPIWESLDKIPFGCGPCGKM